MKIKKLKSFNVQIWCGLKERNTGVRHNINEVESICQEFVNHIKECVSVSPTDFIYVDGKEKGVVIGFIKYPRFPRSNKKIKKRAIKLAKLLMNYFNQYIVTVTTPNESIMLTNELLKKDK